MDVQVKALKPSAGIVVLSLEAADERDAAAQAAAQGYVVLSTARRVRLRDLAEGFRPRFPLALFSQELLALLNAGLSLVESLEALSAKERKAEHRAVIAALLARLREGQPLSAAMASVPEAFPPLYVSTVRAAERTGNIPEALSRYVVYQGRVDHVKKRIVSASIYPALLLAVGALVTLFLLGYVVPRFSAIYEDAGARPPWLSRLLLEWGRVVEAHGALVLMTLFAALGGTLYGLTRRGARARLAAWLGELPAAGERMRVYQLARLYRTVGMLLKGSTPVVGALGMAGGLLEPPLRARLDRAARAIGEGVPLSQAMETHGLTTPVAERLLQVGERTGAMGEMMERIAEFHDEEMSRWVEWFTRLFEPLLMTAIGLVIGAIVWLMYMPVFELAGSIQ